MHQITLLLQISKPQRENLSYFSNVPSEGTEKISAFQVPE